MSQCAIPRDLNPPTEPSDLSPAGVIPWVRVLAVALLGLAVVGSPAQAGGCQAEERPAVGLTYWRDVHDRPDASDPLEPATRHTQRVRRLPCSGQTPASLAPELPTTPALGAPAECIARPSAWFPTPIDGLLSHAPTHHSRLDRPPRVPSRTG